MSGELLRTGGPHNIRRTGRDLYELSVNIPEDGGGFVARECPDRGCRPGYFKVKPGTGLAEQDQAFCPYCRRTTEPNDFLSRAQKKYIERILEQEVTRGVDNMLRDALDLGSRGKKRIGGGMFSIEMSMKSPPVRHVGRPMEEELRRDVRCPACTLEHTVFGLAVWCPDCGVDIFREHVRAELDVVRKMLGDVGGRRGRLGARVAARDVEDALENTVSVFEAALKHIARRCLLESGSSEEEVIRVLEKKVRNAFQNVRRAEEMFRLLVGVELLDELTPDEGEELAQAFVKRHPITHNLGVLDRKYLERATSGESEGREVRIDVAEVTRAVELAEKVLCRVYWTGKHRDEV